MSKIIEKSKNYFTNQRKKMEILFRSAKIKYPKLFDSRYNKQFVIVSFIVLLSLITTVSYATFVYLTREYRAADIRFANLMYSMKIDDVPTKQLSVPANSTKTYEIEVNSLNEIKSNYLVYYTSTNDLSNVKVMYSNLTTGTGEGKIIGTGTRIIKIVVANDSNTDIDLDFSIKGGYVYNNLSLSNGEYKIEGTYDERSITTGDIILRTYLNEKLVEVLPNVEEMQANNYIYDELASGCTNGASISYNPTNTNNNLEISNVGGKTECVAVFHTKDDLTVTILADNLLVSEAPKASSGYILKESKCNNGATITWNEEKGAAEVTNDTSTNTNCVVKFEKSSGAETIISKYSETNTEGLIKIEQPATTQMKATTEYRYSGSSPKNYVSFNGNEVWRIVGVFDVDNGSGTYQQRLKLVRDASIGNYSWDSSEGGYVGEEEVTGINAGQGINQWAKTDSYEGADLMNELNNTYFSAKSAKCYNGSNNSNITCDFTTKGLNETASNMISDARWYTAAASYGSTASQLYVSERSNQIPERDGISTDTVTRTTNWIGKVGLIYISDYGYASKSCSNAEIQVNGFDDNCSDDNWLDTTDSTWTITPSKTAGYYATNYGGDDSRTSSNNRVFPSVYLNSNVKITDGTGTSADPYKLSL